MKRVIRPYRFGSDCEFGFLNTKTGQIHPANAVIRQAPGFIGLDGHPATAEIRPRPSFNVKAHLLDIADAITRIAEHLTTTKNLKHLRMLALPHWGRETFGGHLHCSWFVYEPVTAKLRAADLEFNGGRFITRGHRDMPDSLRRLNLTTVELSAYVLAWEQFSLPSQWEVSVPLNYVMLPLEVGVQLWGAREHRNRSYGSPHDVRDGVSTPPARPEGWLYQHKEYRPPSTWLVHPKLAYAYTGLTKLVMLNFELFQSLGQSTNTHPEQFNSNAVAFTTLFNRLDKVWSQCTITNDLKNLKDTLTELPELAPNWWKTGFIDTNAWLKLMEGLL